MAGRRCAGTGHRARRRRDRRRNPCPAGRRARCRARGRRCRRHRLSCASAGKHAASQYPADDDGSRRDCGSAVADDPPAPPPLAESDDLRRRLGLRGGGRLLGQAAELVVEFSHVSPPVRGGRSRGYSRLAKIGSQRRAAAGQPSLHCADRCAGLGSDLCDRAIAEMIKDDGPPLFGRKLAQRVDERHPVRARSVGARRYGTRSHEQLAETSALPS
jgi:hypothetical protein